MNELRVGLVQKGRSRNKEASAVHSPRSIPAEPRAANDLQPALRRRFIALARPGMSMPCLVSQYARLGVRSGVESRRSCARAGADAGSVEAAELGSLDARLTARTDAPFTSSPIN